MIIRNISELKVLVSALYALKFGVEDDELNEIIRSPFFSKIFNNAVVEMVDSYKNIITIDSSIASVDDWKLENRNAERKKIFEYIKAIHSWDALGEEIQREVIGNLMSPFIFNEKDVNELIDQMKNVQ